MSASVSCSDAADTLYAWLDGALPTRQRSAVTGHVTQCGACREIYDTAARLEARLRQALRQTTPNTAPLQMRIQRAIAKLEMPRAERPTGARARRTVAILAALATLVCAVLVTRAIDNGRNVATERMLLAAPIEDLRMFAASKRPLDIAGTDPRAVAAWFHGKVDFAPPPPPPAVARARLTGGRLSLILDRRAVAYAYDVNGVDASLYVVPADNLALPATGRVVLAEGDAVLWQIGAHTDLMWRDGAFLYALVSSLPRGTHVLLGRALRLNWVTYPLTGAHETPAAP